DEDQMVALDGREIDGLLQLVRQRNQKRPRDRDEISARRGRQTLDRRPEPHAALGRRRDQELLGLERRDDTLYRRPRQVHALRDLAEAQPRGLVLQRAQDRRRPRDHLDLTSGLGEALVHWTPGSLARTT